MNKYTLLLLANIKNSSKTGKITTRAPYSKKAMELCDLMYSKGYIAGYKKVGQKIHVQLKFYNHKAALIFDIRLYSTPGRKLFITHNNLLNGHALNDAVVLSTTEGLLMLADAYQLGLGGEILFKIN